MCSTVNYVWKGPRVLTLQYCFQRCVFTYYQQYKKRIWRRETGVFLILTVTHRGRQCLSLETIKAKMEGLSGVASSMHEAVRHGRSMTTSAVGAKDLIQTQSNNFFRGCAKARTSYPRPFRPMLDRAIGVHQCNVVHAV